MSAPTQIPREIEAEAPELGIKLTIQVRFHPAGRSSFVTAAMREAFDASRMKKSHKGAVSNPESRINSIASENALRRDWDRPEEDAAWRSM
jgi:hypothetical protein